jgi:hypothetical protein
VIQPYSLDAWRDFFLALATATAALLGLMFVAMSVRANEIGTSPTLRKRAQISIQGMATVLIVSLLALIPGMGSLLFAVALVLLTLADVSVYVTATGRVMRQVGRQSMGAWIRTAANGIGTVFTIGAAISLSLNRGGGLYLLVPSLLLVLGLWCIAAWHLIVPPELHAIQDSLKGTRLAGKSSKRRVGRDH